MNLGLKAVGRTSLLIASLLIGAGVLAAADDAGSEIATLKAAIAEQQKQLLMLQKTLETQQALLEKALAAPAARPPFNTSGQVASTSPILPLPVAAARPAPIALPQAAPAAASKNPCEAAPDQNAVPPYIRIGSTCVVPVGFMDLTPFWRDKNAGSSMGSNFGSIPFNNTVNGNLSETRFSIQNSRLGFRVDGNWKGAHFIGYNEFDFNGTSGATNLSISNGAVVPRLRLYWADVRKGNIEFLAGQSWSMLVPNRKGVSAIPGDLFYTQVIDINYMAGLTWTRQPGVRLLLHGAHDKVTFGFSVEQPDQYQGGSAGGSGITLPSALTGLTSTQLDAGANISGASYLGTPAYTPDFIAKLAFDPSPRFHFEIGGLNSNFKVVNPSNLSQKFTKSGGALLAGANVEIFKNFRVISTNYWSDGGGRYLFGQAPDLIVRADGSLSLVHAGGTIDGIEETIKNTLLYAYYGGIYIGRNTALDANGTSRIGFGYNGSPNSQNRAINELTWGFNQTMWKSARYGAINFMGQYEWLERAPWFVAVGAPKKTHDNTIYLNIRYTLPGSMPAF